MCRCELVGLLFSFELVFIGLATCFSGKTGNTARGSGSYSHTEHKDLWVIEKRWIGRDWYLKSRSNSSPSHDKYIAHLIFTKYIFHPFLSSSDWSCIVLFSEIWCTVSWWVWILYVTMHHSINKIINIIGMITGKVFAARETFCIKLGRCDWSEVSQFKMSLSL